MRLRLYAKDIASIEGVSVGYARARISAIRKQCDVAPKKPLFVSQYAAIMRIPESDILAAINGR